MKYKNKEYFKTTSFYPACFLFTKELALIGIERDSKNPKRAQFVFIDSPERELLMESFNFGKENSPEVMVDARKFVMAIKQIKDKLYQDKF